MKNLVENLREEAQVLLQLEQDILNQMSSDGILDRPDEAIHPVDNTTAKSKKSDRAIAAQTEKTQAKDEKIDEANHAPIDTESVKKEIATLRGEGLKLTELEMVLAVVGTMKAGKSTTINAIVGTEILPNRNAPMTAIPTLIKHTKGQKQARLTFTQKASQPANQLIKNLSKRFKEKTYQAELEAFKSDKDLNVTIERIQNGIQIANQALGEKEIFDFLVSMNDLVRIAPKFDEKFPFDQYQEIDQLPVIEVEFTHLKEVEETSGKLILLDTPGPNEAGQAHLRPMLQDQLKKASAVLAVMDYTQLKSEADAQVRADLNGIANTVKNRIYALVNKFDNCDRNGMQENDVKVFVEGLTNGLIKQESVYPVSAKRGYLANQAKNSQKEDGLLPDIDDATWVEDFYEAAGLRRESHRTPERIAEGIEDLWEDSKFSQPLKEVIEVAHKQAAFVALDSAVDKLVECSEKINTVLSIKEKAVHKSARELQELVNNLTKDITSINQTESEAEKSILQHREKFSKNINILIQKEFDDVQKKINASIFSGNKLSADLKKQDKVEQKQKERKSRSFLGSVFNSLEKMSRKFEDYKYDPENPVINFGDHKEKAQEFLDSLAEVISKSNDTTNSNIEAELDTLLDIFETEFKDKIIVEAQKTIEQVNKTLGQSGFEDIKLTLPNRRNLDLKISSSKLMQDALIEDSYKETHTRDRDGVGAWFARKLWGGGKETYTVTVTEYKVDMNKIKKEIEHNSEESQKLLNQSIVKNIEKPLEETSKQFFKDFKNKVSGLRKGIENSLKDKEKSKQNETQFLETVLSMKKTCESVKDRISMLRTTVAENIKA
ncbi:dynamin family protein [Acinetobacter bereziniae]|uniref:dynamin family protein n=1 Tax=Acinetobacter bereziniae TaxID=106648 RepID=UPI001D0E0FFB|nr:dynamin family protein [Acinetobacter bereziniae]